MTKCFRNSLATLCLVLCCGNSYAKIHDFTFTGTPSFAGTMYAGATQSGTYTIQNHVPVPIGINYIRLQNNDAMPASAATITSTTCGQVLGALATCNVTVTLQPPAGLISSQSFNRVLQVGIDTRQIEISGAAITSSVVAPNLAITSPTFISMCLDAPAQLGTYTITNNAPIPVGINSINLTTNSGDTISNENDVTHSTTCGQELGAGASCAFTVNFDPSAVETLNRTLHVTTNTSQGEVNGTAITSSAVDCSSGLVFMSQPNFGSTCIGGTQLGTYTIKNNALAPVTINNILLQNNDLMPASNAIISTASGTNCVAGQSLGAGASCNIGVTLQPPTGTSAQSFNRVLRVLINTSQGELDGTVITSSVTDCSVLDIYNFAIIAYAGTTAAGTSAITGNIDIYPKTPTSIIGYPPSTYTGTLFSADNNPVLANTILGDARTFFTTANSQACVTTFTGDIGSNASPAVATLSTPGVYCFTSSGQIKGSLTLTGGLNDSYTIKTGSTLTTDSSSSIILFGSLLSKNVNWIVGSSATLGASTTFLGNIAAYADITLNDSAVLTGRAWALGMPASSPVGGAVTLGNGANIDASV